MEEGPVARPLLASPSAGCYELILKVIDRLAPAYFEVSAPAGENLMLSG
jgi:hypothetical protein